MMAVEKEWWRVNFLAEDKMLVVCARGTVHPISGSQSEHRRGKFSLKKR